MQTSVTYLRTQFLANIDPRLLWAYRAILMFQRSSLRSSREFVLIFSTVRISVNSLIYWFVDFMSSWLIICTNGITSFDCRVIIIFRLKLCGRVKPGQEEESWPRTWRQLERPCSVAHISKWHTGYGNIPRWEWSWWSTSFVLRALSVLDFVPPKAPQWPDDILPMICWTLNPGPSVKSGWRRHRYFIPLFCLVPCQQGGKMWNLWLGCQV